MKPRSASAPGPAIAGRWLGAAVLSALEQQGTDACRLFSSPEAWLERLGEDLLLSYQTEAARDRILAELPAQQFALGFPCRRLFGRFLPRKNAERTSPLLLQGDPLLSRETTASENGLRFGIDFGAGYAAGLFIDQRANRALVRTLGSGRMLNTFAYTCSFSVASALAGASTVSVDLSKKSLDRGRANFVLNGLDPENHRFLADDVLEVLPRLARRGERFETLVLDPPTFSRNAEGRRFRVEEGMENLLLAALELAAPQARVLLSTNCTRLPRRQLEAVARHCLRTSRRAAEFHTEPALPDVPAEAAATTLWLMLR